jgi:hypothetical protein
MDSSRRWQPTQRSVLKLHLAPTLHWSQTQSSAQMPC